MCIVPRFIIDWLIIVLLLVLRLFASSHHLSLKVSWHLCFAILWRTIWLPLMLCWLYAEKQTCSQGSIIHDLLVCLLVNALTMLAKSIARFISCMPCLEVLWSQLTMLCIWMFEIVIACHLKNYSFYHLPTRGWAGVKLGDADTLQTYL